MSGHAKCRWCEERHEPRWLCDPAKLLLDESRRRGEAGNLPSIELSSPLTAEEMGIGGPDDQILRNVVVMGACGTVGGVRRAGIVLTGRALDGTPLPKWIYFSDDQDMAGLRDLVVAQIDLALRAAEQERGAGG